METIKCKNFKLFPQKIKMQTVSIAHPTVELKVRQLREVLCIRGGVQLAPRMCAMRRRDPGPLTRPTRMAHPMTWVTCPGCGHRAVEEVEQVRGRRRRRGRARVRRPVRRTLSDAALTAERLPSAPPTGLISIGVLGGGVSGERVCLAAASVPTTQATTLSVTEWRVRGDRPRGEREQVRVARPLLHSSQGVKWETLQIKCKKYNVKYSTVSIKILRVQYKSWDLLLWVYSYEYTVQEHKENGGGYQQGVSELQLVQWCRFLNVRAARQVCNPSSPSASNPFPMKKKQVEQLN